MALNLVSGMGLIDPRVDSMKTFAGSAMASFLKIRSDMNLAVWKMRLKFSDPTDLIKLEIDIEERIFDLRKDQAEMHEAAGEQKVKLFKELRTREKDRYDTNMKAAVDLRIEQSRGAREFSGFKRDFDTTELPDDVRQLIQQSVNKIFGSSGGKPGEDKIGGTLQEFLTTAAEVDAAETPAQKAALAKEAKETLAIIQREYRDIGGAAVAKAGESGIATADKPKHAQQRAWLFYYEEPEARIDGMVATARKKLAEAKEKKDAKGALRYERKIQFLKLAEKHMKLGANEAKFGEGNIENQDIKQEWLTSQEGRRWQEERSHGLLEGTIPELYSGTAPGMTQEEMLAKVEEMTGTGPMDDRYDSYYRRLKKRLKNVTDRRKEREATREELLGFRGRNLALDAFSTHPSGLGQTMLGMGQRTESQPHLRDAAGVAAKRFPAGKGGNLTTFIKVRIGRYVDKMNAAGGDRRNIKPDGLGDSMDQIARAVDLYRGSLSTADTTFARPVRIKGGQTTSLLDLVDSYKTVSVDIPDEQKDQFGAAMLDQIKAGDAPIAAEYLSMQRSGTESQKQAAAYNDLLYPLRTNISVVLGPKVDAMIKARDLKDIEGFRAALQDIYKTVEDPKLDELYGSAGTTIRGALKDTDLSSGQIGDMNAAILASRHIEDQHNAMMKQRSEEDTAAQKVGEMTQ